MNGEPSEHEFDTILRAVGEEDARTLNTSSAVEVRLRSEVRSLANARRAQQWQIAAAVAAVLVAVASIAVSRIAPPRASTAVGTPGTGGHHEILTDFFPLVYSNVPTADIRIVRLEVPRATLVSFGLAPFESVDDREAVVLADIVVGEDGLARAVRFVQPAQ